MHRVLRISTENAFCLHSKERVPFHIIIEVAYDSISDFATSEEEKHADSNPDAVGDNPFLQDVRTAPLLEKLKSLASGKKNSENKSIEMK